MKTVRHSLITAIILSVLIAIPVMAGDGGIDQSLLERFEKEFVEGGVPAGLTNAVANNEIKDLSLNREVLIKHDKFINHKLKGTSVVNQRSTGRCWMFAGVNVLGPTVMEKLDLDDFELSEPYLTFYDKLEKANFFLERIIELRDRPLDDRSLQGDIEYFLGDGGWYHYFTSLIYKYGLVPLTAMPETKQSIKSKGFNKLAKSLLRKNAATLRQMHRDGKDVKELRKTKETMLADVYKLLVYFYGKPPTEFKYRYEAEVDSTKQIVEKSYTPKSFFDEFYGDNLPEWVALVDNPAKDYDKLFELEASRNVWENPDFTVLNLPIEKLKDYTMAALLDSQRVWFSCDVGKQNLGDSGIFAEGIYDYNTVFEMDFSLSKADRIRFKEITPNHAMTIIGVDTSATGEPVKWLVENSWGTKPGDKGFWYMYDNWFDEYVLSVIVDKGLLSDDDRKKFDQKPEKIADWEPFFLALRNVH